MKNRSVSTWRHDGELSLFCWWIYLKLRKEFGVWNKKRTFFFYKNWTLVNCPGFHPSPPLPITRSRTRFFFLGHFKALWKIFCVFVFHFILFFFETFPPKIPHTLCGRDIIISIYKYFACILDLNKYIIIKNQLRRKKIGKTQSAIQKICLYRDFDSLSITESWKGPTNQKRK